MALAVLPLVVMLSENGRGQSQQRCEVGKVPTTLARRFTWASARSMALWEPMEPWCSLGKHR